jgi:hypothetical protein
MSAKFINHCGARAIDASDLLSYPVPDTTKTWFPVSHSTVLDETRRALLMGGYTPLREKLSVTRSGSRFFGVIDLETTLGASEVTLAVGIRSSYDKSLSFGLVAGSRVFVCDNLAFSGEITVRRKHTRFGLSDFRSQVQQAIASLPTFAMSESQRISRLINLSLSDSTAESRILRCYESGVLNHQTLPVALKEWRNPSFPDFESRTGWSLYNAVTYALKGMADRNPDGLSLRTRKLFNIISN